MGYPKQPGDDAQAHRELAARHLVALQEIERLRSAERAAYERAIEDAARLHENVNPASDAERLEGHPGAGAMGAVIEYRDRIRALKSPPPQQAEKP